MANKEFKQQKQLYELWGVKQMIELIRELLHRIPHSLTYWSISQINNSGILCFKVGYGENHACVVFPEYDFNEYIGSHENIRKLCFRLIALYKDLELPKSHYSFLHEITK